MFQRIVVSIAFLIFCLAIPSFAETAYQIKIDDTENKTVVANAEKTDRKSDENVEKEQSPAEEENAAEGESAEEEHSAVSATNEDGLVEVEKSEKKTAKEQGPAEDADVAEEKGAEKTEKGAAVEEEEPKELSGDYGWKGEKDVFSASAEDLYEDWVARHFAIGIRYTTYEFDRTNESSTDDEYFVGSIDTMQEEDPDFGLQNIKLSWYPLADSLEWLPESRRDDWHMLFAIIQGIGLELTWDHLRAKTWTSVSERNSEGYTDGTIVAKGPMLSIVFNIENPSPITPYFGFGSADYDDLSVTEGWWHYGYSGSNREEEYQQWRDAGSLGDPNNGYRRKFSVDSGKGSFWYLGADIEIHEDWHLDLFYRETEVEFDNTYTMSVGETVLETRYSKWDLSNTTYGFGVRYVF